MHIGYRKGILALALVLLLLFSSASAQAVSIREFAEGCLMEVLGYTEEEVKDFVFEEREGGVLAYWPKEHPSWVYTTVYKNNVPLESTTPFDRSRYEVNNRPAVEFDMRFFDVYYKDTEQRNRILNLYPKEFKKGY